MWGAKCLLLALLGSMFIAPSHGVITEQLSSAINNFTLDLLQASFNSTNRGNNTILSPLSLYTVLAMLQQGAGGTTQDELNYALHAQPTSTKEGLKSLIQNLTRSHLPVLLEFANKLFVKSGLIISPDFKNVSVEDFKSGIEVLDFSQAEAAAQIINSWVAEYTHQRIPDIIPSHLLTSSTTLLLLNAVFFSAKWEYPFIQQNTTQNAFYTLGGGIKSVPTMSFSQRPLRADQCSSVNVKFVHLPFNDSEFSMLLVVPDERYGLNNVVNNLPGEKLLSFIKFSGFREVNLELPKFKFENTSELKETLQGMELENIFTDSANLSGICASSIKVTGARQTAQIEVDEHGVETSGGTPIPSDPVGTTGDILEINADHPFIFFIVDNTNKVPLLSGWVGQP
ncbi:serine protease inhibitor 42Dd-like [Periplaneta americana]|uniref:serine protease inhibitor 42Dd-like n=1 Tax=Periplaneta americana TaxID=6978 RepID=UPI0037E8F4FF